MQVMFQKMLGTTIKGQEAKRSEPQTVVKNWLAHLCSTGKLNLRVMVFTSRSCLHPKKVFSKNRQVLFAAIRNAHKLRPFCARYLLALSTYTTWFLKKILRLLASLTFFMNIHVCVLEKKHLPMMWLDNPLYSAKHGGAAAGAVLLAGTACGVAEPGLRSRILPQRTSPVQDHATQLPVARNKALSVWAQYFQNRFVFVFFNPLLLRLICSFIPRWKEVKKYLFNKPYHLPLSHYVIYRRTAQPSLSVAVLPQAWVCFDLWRAVQVSWALLSETGPTFTTVFAALATVWGFCAVIKGRVKSKREAGRPGPTGEEPPAIIHPLPAAAGSWQGLAMVPRGTEGEGPLALLNSKEGCWRWVVLNDSS